MIRLLALFTFAALLGGAANAECRFGTGEVEVSVDDLPDAVIEAFDYEYIEPEIPLYNEETGEYVDRPKTYREVLSMAAGTVYVAREDLDGDGRFETCYNFSTTATCSMGVVVCLHMIFASDDATVLLKRGTHMVFPISFPRRGHMKLLQTIEVRSDYNLWSTIYRFGDGEYKADTSVRLGPLFQPQ